MEKFKLAIVTEEYDGEIESFETKAEMDAFARGFSRAGENYGAGHCAAYTLEDVEDQLKNLELEDMSDKYYKKQFDEFSKMREDLQK